MVQSRAGTPGTVGLVVRMPEDLRDRIKAAAETNGRSQNSEIVAALEEQYPAQPDTSEMIDLIWAALGRAGLDKDDPKAQPIINGVIEAWVDFTTGNGPHPRHRDK